MTNRFARRAALAAVAGLWLAVPANAEANCAHQALASRAQNDFELYKAYASRGYAGWEPPPEAVAHATNLESRLNDLMGVPCPPPKAEGAPEPEPEPEAEPEPEGPPPPSPASEEDFRKVQEAVESRWLAGPKLVVLQSAATVHHFSVEQTRALVAQSFHLDWYRVGAGELLCGRVTDQDNWFQVYQDLSFGYAVRKLKRGCP